MFRISRAGQQPIIDVGWVAACLGLVGTVCCTERALASCRCHCRFGGCQQLSIVGILRRKGRRPIATEPDAMPAAALSDRFADDIADRLEIDGALAQLSPDFRAAVVLRDLCQLDYDEIAEVLGIPPGTVRSRIARGRAQLALLVDDRRTGNQLTAYDRPKKSE